MLGFAILFIALSLINIFFPSLGWYTRYGWMVKGDSEPSKAYLVISRVSSIIMLLLFFIFFFPML